MSTKPPATGRVKSMRNRFENLNSLDQIDSLSISLQKPEISNQAKAFRRSSTSFDLIVPKKFDSHSSSNNNNNNNHHHYRRPTTLTTSYGGADGRDGILNILNRNRGATKTNESFKNSISKPPLTEITENVSKAAVPSRLSRHTSDPVKRGSIKRSPAFRIGDKTTLIANKSNSPKLSPINATSTNTTTTTTAATTSTTHTQLVPDQELSEPLLKRSVVDSKIIYHPGITDTLKAALKQPLPTGPPPKKPPRSFLDSPSPNDDISTISMFETIAAAPIDKSSPVPITNELKSKILYLKDNLQLKSCSESRPPLSPPSGGHGLFGCIPLCTSAAPVYDSVRMYSAANATGCQQTNNPVEHIYMEPYGHLKVADEALHCDSSLRTADSSDRFHRNNSSQVSEGSLDSFLSVSGCACREEHAAENGDLHYLCTSIDNTINSESETTSADSDQPCSLTNTYDEINLLVNAAFNDKLMGSRSADHLATAGAATDPNDRSPILGAADVEELLETSPVLLRNAQTTKLSRSLTEKRKDYVQRISARTSNKSTTSTYGTLHKTFKSPVFTTFSMASHDSDDIDNDDTSAASTSSTSERINKYNQLVETINAPPVASVASKNRSTERKVVVTNKIESQQNRTVDDATASSESFQLMFEMCLLVGFNSSTSTAYIKTRFPADRDPPQNVEQLVFPSSKLVHESRTECLEYSLVLTDDHGHHIYGYCRRVLPESCEVCLPLSYCLISQTKAPGFFFKILKEIEQRHGQTDVQSNNLLTALQSRPIPEAGRFLHIKLPSSPHRAGQQKLFMSTNHKNSAKRLSLEVNPKWLTESAAQAAFAETPRDVTSLEKNSKKSGLKSLLQVYEEKKQHQQQHNIGDRDAPPYDLGLINRSLLQRAGSAHSASSNKIDEILIKRPNDLRLESTELSDLYASLGAKLLCNVFGSLLLERKVILFSENISRLSSCVLGLQTILYPFKWQYTLVTLLPRGLSEICQAPFPVLAGLLEPIQSIDAIEDGILVNLDTKQVQHHCGDEATILPAQLRQSLLVSLEMVDILDQGKMLSSVLIAEAFLRFFVELFAGLKNSKVFEKEEFVQAHPLQSVRLFLEWFVETAMFRHFQHEKYNATQNAAVLGDTTYALFDARLLEKSEGDKSNQNMEMIMKNCKIINKKAKTFKDRFRDFLK